LTRENKPSLTGSEEANPMSRFAFGLPYFLFGFGSALNTGEHVIWSINLIQNCPNLCRAVGGEIARFFASSQSGRLRLQH